MNGTIAYVILVAAQRRVIRQKHWNSAHGNAAKLIVCTNMMQNVVDNQRREIDKHNDLLTVGGRTQ